LYPGSRDPPDDNSYLAPAAAEVVLEGPRFWTLSALFDPNDLKLLSELGLELCVTAQARLSLVVRILA
jgi:hypothetical protein